MCMYQGLGQMLTMCLQHHQGCSDTPKCAYVIYGQPLMGEWRVGAHWALGRGAAADTGSTNHSANVLYGDNPDLIPARSSAV